jgi:hypothetical protein
MRPRLTLEAFDRYLTRRALRFEGVVIGGSALVLMGVIHWNTRDVDVAHFAHRDRLNRPS